MHRARVSSKKWKEKERGRRFWIHSIQSWNFSSFPIREDNTIRTGTYSWEETHLSDLNLRPSEGQVMHPREWSDASVQLRLRLHTAWFATPQTFFSLWFRPWYTHMYIHTLHPIVYRFQSYLVSSCMTRIAPQVCEGVKRREEWIWKERGVSVCGKKEQEEKGSGRLCVAIRELVKYIIPLDVSERWWTVRSRLYSISRVPSA